MHSAVLDFVPPSLHHPGRLNPQTPNLAEHDADVLFPVLVQLGVQGVLGVPEVLELPGVVEALLVELVAIQAHQEVVQAIAVD